MRRLFLVLIMLIFSIGVWAQTITLSFTGQDAANHHVQLERVIITNLSQNWQETLYWPDTTLTLNSGVGINDNNDPVGFKLYQNNPNPFNGITDASLTVVDAGSVALEITDVNGRAIENRIYASLPAGTHHYRVTLSAAGTYIMTARQNGKTSSIKMINNGSGGENSIMQLEHVVGEIIAKSGDGTKSNVTHPWAYGDNLTIMGYSTICGTECTKQFSRQLLYNETITIYFSESITTPTVAASSVSNITSNSASVSSSVSGNCGVISRGFCYGTSSNPTISGQHTSNGNGTGSFTGTLSGLTPSTTYYVRAYATNAAGTAYGSQTSFTAPAQPAVTTNNVSNITTNTATGGGNVTSQGTAPVTSRGVCWSTSHNPTIANSHTTNGSGTGGFTSNITGLTQGTTYYVRAYATSSAGTAYGNEVCFTTSVLQVPTVITSTVTNTTSTTATCGGNVTSDGGATVTARGVCWSTSPNPTTNNNYTTNGNGVGSFTSVLTGLSSNTTYYVRAYATNSVGTAYGNEHSFTTPSPFVCGTSLLTDIDGNVYNTVQIGQQCWMRENLKATHYADNTTIPQGNTNTSYTDPYYVHFSNEVYLYNWAAVMHGESSSNANPSGVQGVCPTGWHVPSDAEWTQLTDYVSNRSQYWCNSSSPNIAKALAGTQDWQASTTTCAVGNTPHNNNSTNFSAMPVGYFYGPISSSYSAYDYYGRYTLYWSASANGSMYAYNRCLYYDDPDFSRGQTYLYYGLSVRCLLDDGNALTIQPPVVTTTLVGNVTLNSATCGGNVTDDGGALVSARGVCWSTSHNPTTSDSHTSDGIGLGIFTSSITGLIQQLSHSTTYYVRAYATNSAGTAYGNEESFTIPAARPEGDSLPCPGTPTVTDIDGNIYNTVQIGNQCWMKENLRTTHYADNTEIPEGGSANSNFDSHSYTEPYRFVPNNDTSNISSYGYLYNWSAAMHGASSSGANPSGVQGICPTGWHVPSDAEWTQLINYVKSQNAYRCSGNTYIGKALSSAMGWNSNNEECTIGNDASTNNATGFSALPAGEYYWNVTDHFTYFGDWANFVSSKESGSSPDIAFGGYSLYYNQKSITTDSGYRKDGGYSVRCVRTESGSAAVTTTMPDSITDNTAFCGGDVTDDGGSTITARGVCWSTSHYPTITDSHTTDGTGTGPFTSSITGLSGNTTYYVRAYAINGSSTVYGAEEKFMTLPQGDARPCPGTPAVTDIDGNVYNTVKIGQQCWMKENLRTTKYADNTSISRGYSNSSTTTAYWYYPNNNASNLPNYGLLYNWKAVMRNASSSSSNPSSVQGICPTGWHVPSDAEWTQLMDYVSNQSQYLCNLHYIAKALADTMGWNSSSNSCAIGNNPFANNLTNFSAIPAGRFYYTNYGTYDNFGDYAYFWSCTGYGTATGYGFGLASGGINCSVSSNYYKNFGYSVRCIKN